jgi:hypothetical protein
MSTLLDTPSKFLSQILEMTREGGAARMGRMTVQHFKNLDPTIDWGDADLNWDDPAVRDAFAASLWQILPGELDRPVALAFEKAGLSPKNPLHWRLLFSYFCWAHFRPRRGRGAPEIWSSRQYARLLQDADRLKYSHPRFSKENIYRLISKKGAYKTRNGKPLSAGRIKTALREARDPNCNAHLSALLNDFLQHKRTRHDWTPQVEDEMTRLFIETYCQAIGGAWRRAENPMEY